jgi:hypothetical protein
MTAAHKEAALVKTKSPTGQTNISARLVSRHLRCKQLRIPMMCAQSFAHGWTRKPGRMRCGLVAITKNCLMNGTQHETQEAPFAVPCRHRN